METKKAAPKDGLNQVTAPADYTPTFTKNNRKHLTWAHHRALQPCTEPATARVKRFDEEPPARRFFCGFRIITLRNNELTKYITFRVDVVLLK